jgi:hypothetical protein
MANLTSQLTASYPNQQTIPGLLQGQSFQEEVLSTRLSHHVLTYAFSSGMPQAAFEAASNLVIRGFSRYAAPDKPFDPELKKLSPPSSTYLIIVSFHPTQHGQKPTDYTLFSVMSVARGAIHSGLPYPPMGHIVFSRDSLGETTFLHSLLGIRFDEITEIGNFVCLDENGQSLINTADGFEAYFNSAQLAAIWAWQTDSKVSSAVMSPRVHHVSRFVTRARYHDSSLQPNPTVAFPNGTTVQSFIDNIPGYIKLGTPKQPHLYYMLTSDFHKQLTSRYTVIRAHALARLLRFAKRIR